MLESIWRVDKIDEKVNGVATDDATLQLVPCSNTSEMPRFQEQNINI